MGALALEIVRPYRLRHSEQVHIHHVRRYAIVSLLFVALGGAVAVLLEAKSLHAAFYMGVSLPAVVSAVGGPSQDAYLPNHLSRGAVRKVRVSGCVLTLELSSRAQGILISLVVSAVVF